MFQKGPEAGSDNHVGILCGKTDAGDWIAVHCSSGKNGVTVGEAYSASFRYIRQPSFYPTQEQVQEMQSSSTVSTTTGDAAASTGTDIFSAKCDSKQYSAGCDEVKYFRLNRIHNIGIH